MLREAGELGYDWSFPLSLHIPCLRTEPGTHCPPSPKPSNPDLFVSSSDSGPVAAMTFSLYSPSVNSHFLPELPPVGLCLHYSFQLSWVIFLFCVPLWTG